MVDGLAFLGGMIVIIIVWFVTDGTSHSPYRRGYKQGFFDASELYKRKEEDKNDECI